MLTMCHLRTLGLWLRDLLIVMSVILFCIIAMIAFAPRVFAQAAPNTVADLTAAYFALKFVYALFGAACAVLLLWLYEALLARAVAPRLDEADRVVARMDAGAKENTVTPEEAKITAAILISSTLRFLGVVGMATLFGLYL